MSDNVIIRDGNDNLTTIATEDIGGREYQVVKIGYGSSGTYNEINNLNRLPVDIGDATVSADIIFPKTLEVSGTINSEIINQIGVSSIPAIEILNPVSAIEVINFPLIQEVSGNINVYQESISLSGDTNVRILDSISVSSIPDINISNFPLVQEVSGSLNVTISNPTSSINIDNFPAIQNSIVLNQIGVSSIPTIVISNFPTEFGISGNIQSEIINSISISSIPDINILNQVSAIEVINFPLIQEVSGNINSYQESISLSGDINVRILDSISVSSIPAIEILNPISAIEVINFPLIQEVSAIDLPVTPQGNLINYWPNMESIPTEKVQQNIDPSGALQVRGAFTSDEGSFSTDFTGNTINKLLTGYCLFSTSSDFVSGVGTNFTKEISYGDYVKLSGDSVSAYCRVVSIDSNELIWLESNYNGTDGIDSANISNFEVIINDGSTLNVSNSMIVLDGGYVSGSLVQFAREADFLPTSIILRGFRISQNIPQVDPFFGFFSTNDFRTSDVAAYIYFTSFNSAQLVTRNSLNEYDTNRIAFNLPNNLTTDVKCRWKLDVIDDRVNVYYNDVLMATSFNHLPPIYKSLHFNVGVYNISSPPVPTQLYCDEIQFKNVDVINTASVLQAHIQQTFDSNANTLLAELTSTINSLQATLKSYASIMGLSVDVNGRQRTNIETGTVTANCNINATQTLATVTTVGTVSTITNVPTIGSYAANNIVPTNINTIALSLRQSINVT